MDRKTEILKVTAQILKEKGFDSFSYNDLSQKVGISKASIHHHFKRKEDLGLAMLVFLKEGTVRRHEGVRNLDSSPMDKLDTFFDMQAKVIEYGEKNCPINALQANIAVLTPEMTAVLKEIGELEIDLMASILENGRQEGEMFFKGKAKSHAALIMSMLRGTMQQSRIHGPGFFRQTIEQMKTNLRV